MKIEIIGNLKQNRAWKNPQGGIVYSPNGVMGCLNGLEFRANQPKIIEVDEGLSVEEAEK